MPVKVNAYSAYTPIACSGNVSPMLTPYLLPAQVDTTHSPALPSLPPVVTPPRPETNRDRNYVSTLTSSPAQSLWTAPTGELSERSSQSPVLPELPPRLTFETPSSGSGPSGSVRNGPSSVDANTYYTASWGSPYQRAPSARPLSRLARDRPLDTDSNTASPPFGLDYLVPSRVHLHSRDVTPSFDLDHLIPSRVTPHIPTPVSSDRLALQAEQPLQTSDRTPVRPQNTRSLTEDWVHQYTSGRWRSERGNWLSDESAGSDSSSGKSEDFRTPIPFTW